jgi:6-phosphogluconolactonase/glucosamine-6-phosphate isomerase/deaminase
VAILALDLIIPELRSNLYITLTDERYGTLGHQDSNWRQLEAAGFKATGANIFPVLTGQDILAATRSYNDFLKQELAGAAYKIGLFGIGADGHTAGILPYSSALSSLDLAANYEATDFQRITMTPLAIAQLDEAVVFAVGAAKWPTLEKLKKETAIKEQPAQALKKTAKLLIFTDYK